VRIKLPVTAVLGSSIKSRTTIEIVNQWLQEISFYLDCKHNEKVLINVGYGLVGHWTTDSDQLDMAVVTRGKNDINTVRFLTQSAHFVS